MNDFQELHKGWIRESNLIDKVDSDQADTDSFDAWKMFTEQPITKDSILMLHWSALQHLNHRTAGSYRRSNVTMKPEWKLLPNILAKWIKVHGKARTLTAIRMAHILFEKIQPFEDRNGHTGRMIMNWQALQAGIDPVVIHAVDRELYHQWFTDTDYKKAKEWERQEKKRTLEST